MILDAKQTTVAYRCPHCGSTVMSAVGLFSLTGAADMVKLKCTCGQSEMTVLYGKDGKIRLTVPCLACANPHSFTVSSQVFFGKDLFVLPCPYTDLNVAATGEINLVKAEMARVELELLDLLEKSGIKDPERLRAEEKALPDPQIAEIVMFVIRDLDAEGKIFCKCHPAGSRAGTDGNADGEKTDANGEKTNADGEKTGANGEKTDADGEKAGAGDFDVEIHDNGILVRCTKCGAKRLIPTDSGLSAHAFLNADALYLE